MSAFCYFVLSLFLSSPFQSHLFHQSLKWLMLPLSSGLLCSVLPCTCPTQIPPHSMSLKSLQIVLQIFAHQVSFLNVFFNALNAGCNDIWVIRQTIYIGQDRIEYYTVTTSNLSGLTHKNTFLLHATFPAQISRWSSAYHCHSRTQAHGDSINNCSMITSSERRECGDRRHNLDFQPWSNTCPFYSCFVGQSKSYRHT